ncbi:hypothetical protein [Lacimicrobium sp. SS2-24]|uniref:hypothetical protein n=1 Tax=Lacimicrobium sp. SS2-24 TaxID=2005569 RepID=UPI000B4A8A57|nr:hypothetical protein [Lacimicrobium sp. SS2-24]
MHPSASYQNTPAHSLMRWGASAYFAMPLCYVAMFLIFGVALSIPQSDVVSDKIAYIASEQSLLSLAYVLGYLLFGCLLLVAVQATHARLISTSSHLLNFATAFGLIWVVLMMCSGMIALVGMNTMVKLFSQGSSHADTLFYVYNPIVNGLGGGIELVGGMWVLVLSIHGLKTAQLAKGLHLFGLIVGLLGIGTVFQSLAGIKEAFGLSQIVWFICMGIALLKTHGRAEQ